MATDPASGAAGAGLGYKLGAVIVSMLAPVLAFALGLGVLPLDERDPHRDLVRRLLGCATSSALLGLSGLIALHHWYPWVFESARDISRMILGTGEPGGLAVAWCVLLLAALPGWWLVGAVMRRLATWRDKSLGEIVDDVREVHP